MTRCIYKIINAVNNKFYVGSAVNFEKRKARHLWRLRRGDHANKHLQSAWNKYGADVFLFVIVEAVSNDEDILAAENIWLKEHVGKAYCYNKAMDATAPGTGMHGDKNAMWGKTFNHTEDAKAKISVASKAQIQSEETKTKRRITMKGHELSIATRAKISKTLSGEGNYWYGKKRPDHGEKVSKMVFAMPDGILFASLQQCLAYYEINMSTLRRALVSGEPIKRGKMAGYVFKYGGIAQQTDLDKHLIAKKLGNS